MRLTEIFRSIQGEGPLIGIPMLFVRTNRCNLRCKWCDSAYTFTGGYEMELEEAVGKAVESIDNWICLTGGEPMLQRDSPEFIRRVVKGGKRVLLETGGSLPLDEVAGIDGLTIDMDVKTPSSEEQDSIRLENLGLLRENDYIKFVILDENDYSYALAFLKEHRNIKCGVVFQPAWGTDLKWLTEKVLKDRVDARVLPQLHKLIWGEVPGV